MPEYVDPHDPTDDEESPAPVLEVEESDPVELTPGDPAEVVEPPEEWGDLSEEEIAERTEGLDTSPVDGDEVA
jgi:hypothetical protein